MDWVGLMASQQFLLAAGLQYEKSSRATNMVYVQMLFALAADKLVFDTRPGALELVGSGLILGSAVVVAMGKEGNRPRTGARGDDERGEAVEMARRDGRRDRGGDAEGEEGMGLLTGSDDGSEVGCEDGDGDKD